ncbi:MAG: hypothetical protein AAF958_15735 [Planctomycetota bacterium]
MFVSGLAALSHQLLWTRRLVDLLGASGESNARIFGLFFLGLSIGSALASWLLMRIGDPLRFAGWFQCGIVVLVVPVIYLSELTDWIWPVLGAPTQDFGAASTVKTLLTFGMVLPPTILMGLSFPMIVAAALRWSADGLGRSGLNLYAVNTLGGAGGILLTVLLLLPKFGNFGSMLIATGLDGLVGIGLLLSARRFGVPDETDRMDLDGDSSSDPSGSGFGGLMALAFVSGAAVLSLEVSALRMLQRVATISLFSPAVVLFCAIASLGLAAAGFAKLQNASSRLQPKQTLTLILLAAGTFTLLAPQIFMALARRSIGLADNAGVGSFMLKLGTLAMLSVGPAWLAGGLIFPFALARAGKGCSASLSGSRIGLLLAASGLGGLFGAEFTYRVLLPAVGVYGTMSTLGGAFLALALTVSFWPGRAERADRSALALPTRASNLIRAATLLLVGLLPAFALGNLSLPAVNPPPGIAAIDVRSGREGTVSVLEDRQGNRSILVDNQYVLGGTAVRYDQERQVLLPIALHPNPTQVACIGLATGITPGAALSVPQVEAVTCIEISPLVVDAADRFFSDYNHGICRSDAASVVVGDGRTFLASAPERFDVVTGDLYLPWEPGTSRLYSREHFAAVRESLRPGGVFCQWLPMHQLTPEHFDRIAETLAGEFAEVHLFINHFRVVSPMVALVAGKQPGWLNWRSLEERLLKQRRRESSAYDSIRDPVLRHVSGIRMLYLGPWQPKLTQSKSTGRVALSLADPSLEYSAARTRVTSGSEKAYFGAGRWIQFCRSRQEALAPGDDLQRELTDLATGLMELDNARRTRHPVADRIAAQVTRMMPRPLVQDRAADWKRWSSEDLFGPRRQSTVRLKQ